MKNLLQNLLIVLSLALCGLIWVQWRRETANRREIESQASQLVERDSQLQNLRRQTKSTEAEVTRLEGLKRELTETLQTNRLEAARLSRQIREAEAAAQGTGQQRAAYEQALDTANASIQKQNQMLADQNAQLKSLSAERNALAVKFNQLAEDYAALVERWNAQQAALGRAASNTLSHPGPK